MKKDTVLLLALGVGALFLLGRSNQTATYNPATGNWTPGPGGFPGAGQAGGLLQSIFGGGGTPTGAMPINYQGGNGSAATFSPNTGNWSPGPGGFPTPAAGVGSPGATPYGT